MKSREERGTGASRGRCAARTDLHSRVCLRPPVAFLSAPRPPGGPLSGSAEVGSRKSRSCGGASAPVASTPGAPPPSRGRLLAARLPLSQRVSQRPLTAPARGVWARVRDAGRGRVRRGGGRGRGEWGREGREEERGGQRGEVR